MSSLRAITYVSSAAFVFTAPDLDALLLDARAFNETAGVTGALLHQDGQFLQYFEGPDAGVEEVYDRIKRSRSHRGLIELDASPVRQRHFSAWMMGFTEPVGSALQAASQASWHAKRQAAAAQDVPAPGLTLLLSFWQRAQAGRGSGVSPF